MSQFHGFDDKETKQEYSMMNQTSITTPLLTSKLLGINCLKFEPATILVVDEHIFSRMTTVDLLVADNYKVVEEDNTIGIINRVIETNPDLILLALTMPKMNEFQICKHLKENQKTCLIPIIFTTVADESSLRLQCFEAGGDDILTKPLERMTLSTRVRSLIRQKRLNENLDQTEQLLFSIARAIESRCGKNMKSCVKMADLVRNFGEYLKISPIEIGNLVCAAHLHDLGTILIPDALMLKKEKLTEKEKEILKQHVLFGEEICQPLRNRRGVLPIIRHHHERWDGSGYPDGLVGDEIPWLAQIFQILDIYHALTSVRPHKQAFSSSQALEIIKVETERGWRNPKIVAKFSNFITQTSSSLA